MEKIKILRIIARLNIGGPAIHTILLNSNLNPAFYDSVLVAGEVGKDEGNMDYYALEKGVHVDYIPELKRNLSIFCDLTALIKIFGFICRIRPDIVHTHTAKAGALGRLAAIAFNTIHFKKRKRIKIVHTFHGHIFEGYFNPLKTSLFVGIERFLAIFTDQIITVSQAVKQELLALGIANGKKIVVIPLGFELDDFLTITPKHNTDDFIIGIIGRLVAIKNHRLFLDAGTMIHKKHPELKLRLQIIGDGELRKELEEYSQNLSLSGCIEFKGWQREMAKVYSGLDVVTLTSLNEGTPVSLIEAMASAKIVVATNVGGVPDLLGDKVEIIQKGMTGNFEIRERGIMVTLNDGNSFADALVYAIKNHRELEKTAKNSREFVRHNFSKQRLIRDIEQLYLKLLD